MAGGTFSQIAAGWAADIASGKVVGDEVSATTVRKDVERAKSELIEGATREALRGEHRSIILTMRQANFNAMAAGDVDAAKIILSTLQREAEMFGLDEPKRTQLGVGTNVEFATDLVDLIQSVGFEAPPDLLFAARGERVDREDALAIDRAAPGDTGVLDVEVVGEDEVPNSGGSTSDARPADGEDTTASAANGASPEPPDDDGPWSNL